MKSELQVMSNTVTAKIKKGIKIDLVDAASP
jgi:hypothetical protein